MSRVPKLTLFRGTIPPFEDLDEFEVQMGCLGECDGSSIEDFKCGTSLLEDDYLDTDLGECALIFEYNTHSTGGGGNTNVFYDY